MMLPPNALLTVFMSASGIEAKATARRSVSGALNTVRGTGPLIDDAACGRLGWSSPIPRSRRPASPAAHRSTAPAISQTPVNVILSRNSHRRVGNELAR